MRTFPRWAQALVALSVLTLSAAASADTSGGSASAADPAPQTQHAVRKHVRRATATARKAKHARTADRTKTNQARARKSDKGDKSAATAPPPTVHKKTARSAKPHKAPAAPAAKPASSKHGRSAKIAAPSAGRHANAPTPAPIRPCNHEPVTFVRGADNHTESLPLTRCNGRPVDGALAQLTVLLAPNLAGKQEPAHARHGHRATTRHASTASLDQGLLSRLQAVASHFPNKAVRVVSSYRPLSPRSYHQSGRALDFVVTGISNEDLVAFCRTLPDTGCGYYPNSSFVHMDVRKPGTGHVVWIDASKPGEPARYVTGWPEKPDRAASAALPPPDADAIRDENAVHVDTGGASNGPPAQPLTGDLELDSHDDENGR